MTEGEEWVRRELELLLGRRFSPRAVVAFLRHSQQRARAVRAARPELARQARVWTAVGFAAVLLAVPRSRWRGALSWWAACAVMLDWHLGMLETEEGEPRPLGPADAVTLARAWSVPIAWHGASPPLAFAAWASDGLDGALARRTAPTRAGRDLEGLVDTCFAVAALRGARATGGLGPAAVRAESARLAAGFAYALWVYFGTAAAPDPAVTKAARRTTPLRVGSLAAAGSGHRRTADALLLGGSAWSVLALARALRGPGSRRPVRLTAHAPGTLVRSCA